MPRTPLIAAVLVSFCAGAMAAYAYFDHASGISGVGGLVPSDPAVRETGKYRLTAPLLLCPSYDSSNVSQNAELKATVESIIQQKEAAGEATDIAVYFRGFNGAWMGINENEQFTPASLLKVPLMIAYYREAEDDPSILNKTLVYDGSFDDNAGETFHSENDIQPGAYTIDNLIKAMIVNSDNNAMVLLDQNIDQNMLSSVYTDLGLDVPTQATVSTISPKQYSEFFRVLYNSTYLTPAYSEKALELLAGPDFPQGIQATVPSNVVVANKFGERTVVSPTGVVEERELHDCGIIYGPAHSYVVCIMTRGTGFQQLDDVIQSISRAIYQSQS